jgi:outer membrane beta-barrel protein
MRKAASLALAIAVASGVVTTTERSAHAQEIVLTGPLKGAPPVIKLRLYREGRLEIAPMIAFTLLDEYQHGYLFGGRINYYITDWLAVGVWGGGVVSSNTDLTSQIDNIAPRNEFTATNVAPCVPNGAVTQPAATCPANTNHPSFSDQTAKMAWAVLPQVTAVPFRGKLALFQALFVDTEAYLFFGLGAVGFNQRANCGDPTANPAQPACSAAASFNTTGTALFTLSGGIGLTFFINDLVNVGVEYRVLGYVGSGVNRGGFDSRGLGPGENFPDGKVNGQDATSNIDNLIGISVGVMLGRRKVSAQ